MTDNVYDIQTKKPVKPDMPENATINQWMNCWKKYIKDNKAQTVAIIGVGEDGYAFYDLIGVSELDLLKIYRRTKDLKMAIDDILEPPIDLEIDIDLE